MKELHVMIVDDDADDRHFLKEGFTGQPGNIRFTEVTNGQAALDHLNIIQSTDEANADYPQVIFLDLYMPGMGGYDTLLALKAEPSFSRIPVMIISSSTLEREREQCMSKGCEHFFTKPASLEEYRHTAADTISFLSSKQSK